MPARMFKFKKLDIKSPVKKTEVSAEQNSEKEAATKQPESSSQTKIEEKPKKEYTGLSAILLKENYISEEELEKAEEGAKKANQELSNYLVQNSIITKDLIGQAMAESFGVSYADISKKPPSKDDVLLLPEDVSRQNNIVVFEQKENEVLVATNNPTDTQIAELVKGIVNKPVRLVFGFPEEIEQLFSYYQKPLETRFSEITAAGTRVAPEVINELFKDAFTLHASDIHFEPDDEEVVIRYRVDGILQRVGTVKKSLYENILNRIKVMARLRIDEHFAAQDGAIHYEDAAIDVDMRVSIIPVLNGEKIALRILSSYVKDYTLGDIGLNAENQALLEEASKKPFGMILVTGPTGSGKSTTLYALLKILNKPELNVTTIEDPVEYKIKGVNQIQVNTTTGLTFAKGLRSIVRQDPNIILVGEIRDSETAEIAVNAALTGHLLLSTFHANDAATSVPRLLEIGVEPFLLASTLELIIAQRLVRKICESCRVSKSTKGEEIKKMYPHIASSFTEKTITLYSGKGCSVCNNTGYKGRTAVFSFLKITPEMEDLMLSNPSTNVVWQLAKKQGSKSLFEDGVEKVKSGVTTIEELLRVAQPDNTKTEIVKKSRKK